MFGRNVTLFSETGQGHKGTPIGGRESALVVEKRRELEERNYCLVYGSGTVYQKRR